MRINVLLTLGILLILGGISSFFLFPFFFAKLVGSLMIGFGVTLFLIGLLLQPKVIIEI